MGSVGGGSGNASPHDDPQRERDAADHERPEADRPRVLVVDDHEDAGMMLAEVLSISGFTPLHVLDGPSALAQVEAFRPHAALIDIGLPDMDGYELARRLRALPTLAATRLIAVTGHGLDADRARSREAGFDHHLVKPVEIPALLAALADLGG